MGNGALSGVPALDTFKKFTEEYDKMKAVGLSVDEMHLILQKRMGDLSTEPPGKEDGARQAEETHSDHDAKPKVVKFETQADSGLIDSTNGLVLLIDDSPVAAKVATKVLNGLHFEVVTASSAKIGFDILLARSDEVILIFLDVVMPNVDGVECLSWIKENADVAHIPVYMLSGLEDQLLTDVCIERGAEGMLLKPLNQNIVKSIIKLHNFDVRGVNFGEAPKDNLAPPVTTKSVAVSPAVAVKSIAEKKPKVVIPRTLISVNSQAPAFKLCDSDFQTYSFPFNNMTSCTYLVFIPTIYCGELYSLDGFMGRLFMHYDQLCANGDTIVCISGDLPYALAAAKQRFSLPFTLLSDPSLFVSQRFVGSIDIGAIMARSENNNSSSGTSTTTTATATNNVSTAVTLSSEPDPTLHPQNSYMGPNLGILYVNQKSRQVLNKWLPPATATVQLPSPTSTGTASPSAVGVVAAAPNFHSFPSDLLSWAAASSRSATSPSNLANNGSTTTQTAAVKVHIGPETDNSNSNGNRSVASSPRHRSNSSNSNLANRNTSNNNNNSNSSNSSPANRNTSNNNNSNNISNNNNNSSNNNKTVLIVDDSSVSSRVACRKLEALGYSVTCAYNGQLAYDLLKRSPPHKFSLMLVDVVMPVCDGMELLRMLKADAELRHIPVIMLSGLDGEELSRNCLELGAIDLMKKPFDDQKFFEIVKKIFSG